MKTKLPSILTTICRSIKQEFQGSPIKTSLAVIAFLSVSGLGIYSHRHISALITKTEETNISAITFAILLLGVSFLLLRKQRQRTNQNSAVRNDLIEAEGFKWETTYQNKSIINVSDIPFCKTHNLRLTKFKDTYDCMENDCTTSIKTNMLPIVIRLPSIILNDI